MDKKDKIIHAAIEMFTNKGIDKTTISDIVKLAEIGQGTFYLYFPSKLSLMPAIAEIIVERMLTRLKADVLSTTITKQIDEIIDVIYSFTDEHQDHIKITYVGLTQTKEVNEWEQIYTPVYQWIEEKLQRAQQQALISSHVDTHFAAKIIVGSIESAAEQCYLFDAHADENIQSHRNELVRFIKSALGIA